MAQGDLAAVTDEQLDPHGGEDGISDDIGNRDQVKTGKFRDEVKEGDEEQDHLSPDEFGLPPGMVLTIVLVINTARSITHIKPPMVNAKLQCQNLLNDDDLNGN